MGTQWGVAAYQYQRPEKPRWRTLVYLPAEWAGADQGLAQLDNLYHLNGLYLVQAGISYQGLRYVGQLKDLEALYLVDTKATDSGIAHLQTLPNLSYLRLQGTSGAGGLGDAALRDLNKLPRLIAIALAGRGFTDDGLLSLQHSQTLRELAIYDTSITPAGIADLKKKKTWLKVSERLAD